MSKEQLTEQQQEQETAPGTTAVQEETYGLHPQIVAQLRRLSPADDAALAKLLQNYPSHMGKILQIAAGHMGNAAVQRAIAIVKRWRAEGQGHSQRQEFVNAMMDSPADATAVKEKDVASFIEDKSDPQAPDETPKPKEAAAADPAWVADARRYNAAHTGLVAKFVDIMKDKSFLGPDGEIDAKKVAAFQRSRGLNGDGKVGPQTIAAAHEYMESHKTESVGME